MGSFKLLEVSSYRAIREDIARQRRTRLNIGQSLPGRLALVVVGLYQMRGCNVTKTHAEVPIRRHVT